MIQEIKVDILIQARYTHKSRGIYLSGSVCCFRISLVDIKLDNQQHSFRVCLNSVAQVDDPAWANLHSGKLDLERQVACLWTKRGHTHSPSVCLSIYLSVSLLLNLSARADIPIRCADLPCLRKVHSALEVERALTSGCLSFSLCCSCFLSNYARQPD